jgi:hypothetical protein
MLTHLLMHTGLIMFCLRCHLIMPTCLTYGFLRLLMHAYVYLFICLWSMTSREGKICWDYMVWRKGKWLEGIMVWKGIYVYKGTCPPAALSFFLSSSCNVLYSYSIQLCSLLSLLPGPRILRLPSRPSCTCPRLAQSPRLCPHCAKSALATPPPESQKVTSPAAPCPLPRRRSVHARSCSRVPVPARREFLGFRSRSSPAVTPSALHHDVGSCIWKLYVNPQ